MISKNKIKFISSLHLKKARDKENLFIIEGEKIIKEFLEAGMHLKILAATTEFISALPSFTLKQIENIEVASDNELKQMSSLKTPHNALAVLNKLYNENEDNLPEKLSVALDCIQDPGNLGTIIRAAAWFGIDTILCSNDCVDVYNPKVVQASMGALLHVKVYYTDLTKYFKNINEIPVYGALLEGNTIYNQPIDNKGIILLGNESKGISDKLLPFITHKITIPGANSLKPGIDSLNAGMAASIIFSEFYRRTL
jgi:TrmH family RNA methyltransferase